MLEHEFVNPVKEAVEDALDISVLFEAYTEKFLHNALKSFEFVNSEMGSLGFEIDYKNRKIIIEAFLNQPNTAERKRIKKVISIYEKDYNEYLKIFIGIYKIL